MKRFWKCYPPFVDAYRESPFDLSEEYDKVSEKKAYDDLVSAMKDNAFRWGMEGIGVCVLNTGEPPTVDGNIIMQLGYLYIKDGRGKEKRKKLALVVDRDKAGYWWDNLEIVEFEYPDEWNVT